MSEQKFVRKSKASLIALIIGALALVFQFTTMKSQVGGTTSSAEQAGMAIGMALVLPSVGALAVAVLLNAIGHFAVNRTLTLISAILYTLALILFPLWGFVAIPSMILQYVAFARMNKPKV